MAIIATKVNAQIKIVNNGRIGIGTNSVASNEKMVINAGTNRALLLQTNHTSDWWQSSAAHVNRANTTSWVVRYSGSDRFFVHGTGYIYANGAYYSSDLKLKTDIETLQSPLETVLSLRGVSYMQKEDSEEYEKSIKEGILIEKPMRKIGFIADEVQAVVPELVKTTPDGTKALAYYSITALNVEAIKEQQRIIDSMKQEIVNLREQLLEYRSINNPIVGSNENPFSGQKTVLYQNKPNPFNETTTIQYEINETNFHSASVMIFDMNGSFLKEYPIKQAGKSILTIRGSELSAGMYMYTLVLNNQEVDTKRMILSK